MNLTNKQKNVIDNFNDTEVDLDKTNSLEDVKENNKRVVKVIDGLVEKVDKRIITQDGRNLLKG